MESNAALLARIEKLENRVVSLQNGLASQQAAFRNRATLNAGSGGTAVTAGMLLNFAAVLIGVQASGLFNVSIDFAYSGATAATAEAFDVTTQTSAAAITLGNASVIGSPGVAAANPSIYLANAAGGITVTAGGGGAITQTNQLWTTATAQTTGTLSWSAIVQNTTATGAFAPFAKGNNVAILFAINSGTSAMTIAGVSIDVFELPN